VDGQVVEDYIVDGMGTARRAAQGLSVWSSVTTQNLIEWLRSWNSAHPDDLVHFFGFDVQQPAEDKQALSDYLMKQGGATLLGGISECDLATSTMPMFTQAEFDHCMAGLQAIDDFLQSFSGDELEWARVALVGLRAWQPSIFYDQTDLKTAMEARDTGMAYVFQKTRMLKFPSTKIILWAHNEHLEQDHPSIVNGFGEGSRAMGTQLHDALGSDFVSVGLCGYDVNIDWPNVGCGSIGTPKLSTDVEVMLHNLGQNYLLIDLSKSFFDATTQYGFAIYQKLIPAKQFQGLIYLEHDPKMDPLDWPSCTP
jgi:erythromycin esterase-like protein